MAPEPGKEKSDDKILNRLQELHHVCTGCFELSRIQNCTTCDIEKERQKYILQLMVFHCQMKSNKLPTTP